jgi:hypothetical protein
VASFSQWWRDVEGWSRTKVVEEVEDGLGSFLTNLIELWCTGGGRGAKLGSMPAMATGLGKPSQSLGEGEREGNRREMMCSRLRRSLLWWWLKWRSLEETYLWVTNVGSWHQDLFSVGKIFW